MKSILLSDKKHELEVARYTERIVLTVQPVQHPQIARSQICLFPDEARQLRDELSRLLDSE